ncbi:MAG: fructosamine kinase family protein [Planctomycetota bacterium]
MSEGYLVPTPELVDHAGTGIEEPSLELATELVRTHVGLGLTVVRSERLYGGSINRVLRWETDGEPGYVVAKLNTARSLRAFRGEFDSLRWFGANTSLPVPEPIAVLEPDREGVGYAGSGLLMEWVPGVTLASARLSERGRAVFESRLAGYVSELHSHTRSSYGSAVGGESYGAWIECFSPLIHEEYSAVRESLSSGSREVIDALLAHLPRYLPERSRPTATHGDLWANNILVDDSHPDRPVVKALIDGVARYCDPEYELAYLTLFRAVGRTFFERYHAVHPKRPGFGFRSRVYWLKTMMRHVRVFGERYVPSVESLAAELRRMQPEYAAKMR